MGQHPAHGGDRLVRLLHAHPAGTERPGQPGEVDLGVERSKEPGKPCSGMSCSRQYWAMLSSSSRYLRLLHTTNLASMPWRAAVHSAWYVYMDPPSPAKPTTSRSGRASLAPTAPGKPTPSEPPA